MRLNNIHRTALAAATLATASMNASAGARYDFGDDQYVTFGFGTRYTYTRAERPSANGGGHINDPNLDSARLYFGASLNKYVKATFSTEWDGAKERIRKLDMYAQFEFTPEFNVWAGRFVGPSERANMAGPYYSVGGGYWPCVSSRYGCNGGTYVARDDGVAVWGHVAESRLGYAIGVFDGRHFGIGALNRPEARQAGLKTSDDLMYSGRLQYDFWDLETGYFSTADHLGKADILAIGAAFRHQKNGVITLLGKGDYDSYNVDFQLEKNFKGYGAFGLEAAYYDYDTDGLVRSEQGKAYSAGVSYVFEREVGWGRFQPFVHWQRFNADNHVTTKQIDLGLNYVIAEQNAMVTATYSRNKVNQGGENLSRFVLALQLQY
ncbi:MAG: porin [Burkholderiaceae bacterium]|nr:porin [Burkholderiaceae bacterium]